MQLERKFIISNVRFDEFDRTAVIVYLRQVEEPKAKDEPEEVNPFDMKSLIKGVSGAVNERPASENTIMQLPMQISNYVKSGLSLGTTVKLSVEVAEAVGV